jgi:hypothetical protein
MGHRLARMHVRPTKHRSHPTLADARTQLIALSNQGFGVMKMPLPMRASVCRSQRAVGPPSSSSVWTRCATRLRFASMFPPWVGANDELRPLPGLDGEDWAGPRRPGVASL